MGILATIALFILFGSSLKHHPTPQKTVAASEPQILSDEEMSQVCGPKVAEQKR